ncbi:hypothetical protein R69927_00131 [Paraburkholderia domus]|nr:hypothetical protein R69927_00131 [Paraburkholderia domus]
MNRIPKAVYTKEFREDAVKLVMTRGRRQIGGCASAFNIDRHWRTGYVQRRPASLKASISIRSHSRKSKLSWGGSTGNWPK